MKTAARYEEAYWFALALIAQKTSPEEALAKAFARYPLEEGHKAWVKSQIEKRVRLGPVSPTELPTAFRPA